MHKLSILDRILLLGTALLAGYQIAFGIEGLDAAVVFFYTIGYGVLLVASILLIILGFEALESPLVIAIAAFIPLCISLGLVWQFFPDYKIGYSVIALLGFIAIFITRYRFPGRPATIAVTLTHGLAGSLIFVLPIILSMQRKTAYGFMLVGLGGALFGIGGLSFAFLRSGKMILPSTRIFKLLPGLLLLMTLSFVIGMGLA
jgi:hypothetical protein